MGGFNLDVKGTDCSQPTLNQESCSRSTPWDVSLPECRLQPLRNRLDEEKLHTVPDLPRNIVVDVFPVRPSKYHLLHTRSVCPQDLFFNPAYGFDAAAKGDLQVDEDVRIRGDSVERVALPLQSWQYRRVRISP